MVLDVTALKAKERHNAAMEIGNKCDSPEKPNDTVIPSKAGVQAPEGKC